MEITLPLIVLFHYYNSNKIDYKIERSHKLLITGHNELVLLVRIKQMIFLESCTNLSTNTTGTDLFNSTSYGYLSLAISVNSCVFMEEMRFTDNILTKIWLQRFISILELGRGRAASGLYHITMAVVSILYLT